MFKGHSKKIAHPTLSLQTLKSVLTVASLQHLGHSQQLLISVTILQSPLMSFKQGG